MYHLFDIRFVSDEACESCLFLSVNVCDQCAASSRLRCVFEVTSDLSGSSRTSDRPYWHSFIFA